MKNNEQSHTWNHFKNWFQERRYVKDSCINWLSKFRGLNPKNLQSILNRYLLSGGRQFSSKKGHFQAIKHVVSYLLLVTISKLALVVDKRWLRGACNVAGRYQYLSSDRAKTLSLYVKTHFMSFFSGLFFKFGIVFEKK